MTHDPFQQGYPQQPQGYPQQPQVETLAMGTVLPPAPPARGKRGRGLLIVGATAAGVAVIATGAVAAKGLLGGGSRADQHLPGTAIAAGMIDLDPSAGQKINALQFAHKFPKTGNLDWASADNDPRKWIYEQLVKGKDKAPSWSEVDAWLGPRAGFAALPPSGSGRTPVPVLAVQVKDVAKAKATLTAQSSTFVAVDGDWIIVSDTQAHADAAVAATTSQPLSASATYLADMKAVGEPGIADVWVDLTGLSKLSHDGG